MGGEGSQAQQNQILSTPLQEVREGLKLLLAKQKQNRTSSLTQLASGILFPHSNLLLILPFTELHCEAGKEPTARRGTSVAASGAPKNSTNSTFPFS